MKSIMMTYPNFQALPKGLKQMLLASESFFFDEAAGTPDAERDRKQTMPVFSMSNGRLVAGPLLQSSWRN
jgi:hypothetical protein